MTTEIPIYGVGEQQFRREVQTRFGEPVTQPVYTIATLPTASLWPYATVAVSDGASNQRLVVSDGTVWRYPSGSAV